MQIVVPQEVLRLHEVVLEEAVQISNKFSTADSSRFINGILNQFARDKGMLAKSDRSEDK